MRSNAGRKGVTPMIKAIQKLLASIGGMLSRKKTQPTQRKWAKRTLVVGPSQPVDGDSVATTAALIDYLRKQGLEAYTLPTIAMYKQIDWILSKEDIHPLCHSLLRDDLTTKDLQAAYDAVIAGWRPDEVVLVDGLEQGFDTRGVKRYRIDHHLGEHGEGACDNEDAYVKLAPAAACLLIERFGICEPILAIAILTDTFWFRHNMPAAAVSYMDKLVQNGLTDELLADYQKRLMVRKDSRILRAIQKSEMRTAANGDAVFLVLEESDPEIHRGVMSELGYFCRHMCAVRGDGYVSFRTVDERIDLRPLATKYHGGGHANQAAGRDIDVENQAELERLFKDFVAAVEKFGVPALKR